MFVAVIYPHAGGRFLHRVNGKSDRIKARTTCTSELSPFISEYKGSQNQVYRYLKQYRAQRTILEVNTPDSNFFFYSLHIIQCTVGQEVPVCPIS